MLRAGPRELRTAVLFPREHERGSRRLPVIMDPYGGPHAQQVVAASRAFLESQWLADQGFCVIVADGRGTPGRGSAWDRTVRDQLAEVTLADQVDEVAPEDWELLQQQIVEGRSYADLGSASGKSEVALRKRRFDALRKPSFSVHRQPSPYQPRCPCPR